VQQPAAFKGSREENHENPLEQAGQPRFELDTFQIQNVGNKILFHYN
jgi:hypothetical protein